MAIDKILDKLKQEIRDITKKYETLKVLNDKYPDLELFTNRWNKEYYCSKEINKSADKCDFYHSCGCCTDSPLLVSCYQEIRGMKVYANPFDICIGEKVEYNHTESIYEDWKERLEKVEYNSNIISQVEEYIKPFNKTIDFESID